jgi:hypothetical protein
VVHERVGCELGVRKGGREGLEERDDAFHTRRLVRCRVVVDDVGGEDLPEAVQLAGVDQLSEMLLGGDVLL